jgi:prepilin-type processing-associated H-X9-DG protein
MNGTNDSSPAADVSAPQAAVGKTSRLALAALILGIPGLCLFPLGIIALILGIIALIQIADPQRQLVGKGMAVAGTVLGGLSIALIPFILLMIGILLPALGAARTAAQSAVDMSNLRQIGVVMFGYAADNNDVLPDHPRDVVIYLGNQAQPQDVFISPQHDPNTVLDRGDSDGTAVRYGSYVFLLPGVAFDDIDSPSYTVLAYTAKASDTQPKRNVLFADGHAERMEEQDFLALLPPEVDVDALDGP